MTTEDSSSYTKKLTDMLNIDIKFTQCSYDGSGVYKRPSLGWYGVKKIYYRFLVFFDSYLELFTEQKCCFQVESSVRIREHNIPYFLATNRRFFTKRKSPTNAN